jgi:ParB family chromosome partitioning protein
VKHFLSKKLKFMPVKLKNFPKIFRNTSQQNKVVLGRKRNSKKNLGGSLCMTDKKKERPKHLGRGLASLLGPIMLEPVEIKQAIPIVALDPNIRQDKELQNGLQEIAVDVISPNPYQPRITWDEEELAELAESIKTNGVIQPIIVRPAGSGYQLIAGERRLRAAKAASLKTIPAMVRQATDEQVLELALVENIHRTNLNPIERARAYQTYLSAFSLTQAEAAQRLGEDRSVIANYLRLLDLPEDIHRMLIDGRLSMGHARAILALPTDELRRKLANRAFAGRLSVREVEKLTQKYLAQTGQMRTTARSKPHHIIDLEAKLTSQLGAKVSIETRKNGQKGKIIIEFHSLDEFDGIMEKIGLVSVAEI